MRRACCSTSGGDFHVDPGCLNVLVDGRQRLVLNPRGQLLIDRCSPLLRLAICLWNGRAIADEFRDQLAHVICDVDVL